MYLLLFCSYDFSWISNFSTTTIIFQSMKIKIKGRLMSKKASFWVSSCEQVDWQWNDFLIIFTFCFAFTKLNLCSHTNIDRIALRSIKIILASHLEMCNFNIFFQIIFFVVGFVDLLLLSCFSFACCIFFGLLFLKSTFLFIRKKCEIRTKWLSFEIQTEYVQLNFTFLLCLISTMM